MSFPISAPPLEPQIRGHFYWALKGTLSLGYNTRQREMDKAQQKCPPRLPSSTVPWFCCLPKFASRRIDVPPTVCRESRKRFNKFRPRESVRTVRSSCCRFRRPSLAGVWIHYGEMLHAFHTCPVIVDFPAYFMRICNVFSPTSNWGNRRWSAPLPEVRVAAAVRALVRGREKG